MNNINRIYPGREKVYEQQLEKLEKSNIGQRNKDLLNQFQSALFSGKAREYRVSKVLGQMLRLCKALGAEMNIHRDLDELTKADIELIVAYYNKNCKSVATACDYRRSMKQFYNWFIEEDPRLESSDSKERDEAKKLYKHIKKVGTHFEPKQISFKEIISEEDIELVLTKGCRTLKERALISFLHESGVRAGELLSMRIGDIIFNEKTCKITVDGKTGMRTILIAKSKKYLSQYLDSHPDKDSPLAYLWISEGTNTLGNPIKHKGASKLVERCYERAGLKGKRKNLHWLRHSRASLLAPHLTEALLTKFMGWELGSEQVKVYLHLSTKQVDDAILEMHGLKETKDKEQARPIKCNCGAINPREGSFCYNCGNPLSVISAIEREETIKSQMDASVKMMMELAQNPEFIKKFEEYKSARNEK